MTRSTPHSRMPSPTASSLGGSRERIRLPARPKRQASQWSQSSNFTISVGNNLAVPGQSGPATRR